MKKYLFWLLCMGAISSVSAQAPRFSNDFLNIGVGARSHAMSGAVVGSVRDVSATYWNPAALTRIDAPFQIGAMHALWFGGIGSYDFISIGKKFGSQRNGFGSLGVVRLAIDQIPNTINLISDDGSINYDAIEEFSIADYAFFLSYGQRIRGTAWSLGGSVKVIHRSYGTFAQAWGFGFDGSVQGAWDHWMVGAQVRDASSTFNAWSFHFTEQEKNVLLQTNNDLPKSSIESTLPTFNLAVAYKMHLGSRVQLLAEVDLVNSFNGRKYAILGGENWDVDPRVGVELTFFDRVFVRGGVGNFQELSNDVDGLSTYTDFQPTVGLGLRLGRLVIDYAYTDIGDQSTVESSHIVSATLSLVARKRGSEAN